MTTLRLYAPAVVLLLWGIFDSVGLGGDGVVLVLLAAAVALHVQTEIGCRRRERNKNG